MQVRPISTSGECAPHDGARRHRAGRPQRLAAAGLTITACCLAAMAGPSLAGAHGHGKPPRGHLLSGYGGGGGGIPQRIVTSSLPPSVLRMTGAG